MTDYSTGDTWEEHYRGYELRINADEEVWWQVYNGTDRLHLEPKPEGLIETFLQFKPLGGRVRVTEGGAVITRQEDEGADGSRGAASLNEYTALYVGDLELTGDLVPTTASEHRVAVRPDDLSTGDLWPSVYDGSRYSSSMDGRAWWHNPRTKKRHSVVGGVPESITTALTRLKPQGGSFRITPWGDVITLIDSPATETVNEQFGDLPRVIRNIIKLRRDRGDLQMLPVYVGQLNDVPLTVEEPSSLTDQLTDKEQESLEGWAASLGSTTSTSPEQHKAGHTDTLKPSSGEDGPTESNEAEEEDESEAPTDDPVTWLVEAMDDDGETKL